MGEIFFGYKINNYKEKIGHGIKSLHGFRELKLWGVGISIDHKSLQQQNILLVVVFFLGFWVFDLEVGRMPATRLRFEDWLEGASNLNPWEDIIVLM